MPFTTSNFGDGESSALGKLFSILVSKTAIHEGYLKIFACIAVRHIYTEYCRKKKRGLTAGVHGLSQESAAASQKSRNNKNMNCTRLRQNSNFPSCRALPTFFCGWDTVHKCVNEMFPLIAFLETGRRKCGFFVFPSHPLFLRAQHRGFLALPMQFFKSATSSATYMGPNLLEGIMAIPNEGQSCVLALWDVAMPAPLAGWAFPVPAATAWHYLSALLWVLPLCTHPALLTPQKEGWNVKHSINLGFSVNWYTMGWLTPILAAVHCVPLISAGPTICQCTGVSKLSQFNNLTQNKWLSGWISMWVTRAGVQDVI